MRSFIGIDFAREVKTEISRLQSKLRAYSVAGRWKYIDNFHLTLKFLDEIDSDMVSKIDEALTRISSVMDPFVLSMDNLGNFPGKDCLRVLWLGLGGELIKLRNLQSRIDDELQPLGFTRERRGYVPHITIAQDVAFSKEFEDIRNIVMDIKFHEIKVNGIHLFKSEQIGNKRVYTSIKDYKF